jgi:hypothetical protein
MPQIVKADIGQTRFSEYSFKVIEQIRGVNKSSDSRRQPSLAVWRHKLQQGRINGGDGCRVSGPATLASSKSP